MQTKKRDSNGHTYDCPEHWQLANADNHGAVIDTAFPCTCQPEPHGQEGK